MEVTVDLSFMEAALGVAKPVTFARTEICHGCDGKAVKPGHHWTRCNTCHGQGQESISKGGFTFYSLCRHCSGRGKVNPHPCSLCLGKGTKSKTVELECSIPAGVTEETVLSVPSQGHVFPGQKAGDVLLRFKVSHTVTAL